MAEPSAIASLKAYYNVPAHTIDVREVMETLAAESDRTVVVVYSSLLEDALGEMLRRNLRDDLDAKEMKELRLFNTDGPFGTFSTRINVAYAMGIIDEHTRADLQDFREMRNACAHSFKPISLATPELANVCLRLFKPEREAFLMRDEPTQEALRGGLLWRFTDLLMTITLGSRKAARKALLELALDDPSSKIHDQDGAEAPEEIRASLRDKLNEPPQ